VEQLQYKRTAQWMYIPRLVDWSTAVFTLVSVQHVWRESATIQRSCWLFVSFVQQHRTRYIY